MVRRWDRSVTWILHCQKGLVVSYLSRFTLGDDRYDLHLALEIFSPRLSTAFRLLPSVCTDVLCIIRSAI